MNVGENCCSISAQKTTRQVFLTICSQSENTDTDLKGWFHGSAHVQAMTQDKSIPLFMDQSEASMLSRAKFARDSLPVKFTVSWLSHSIDSLLV